MKDCIFCQIINKSTPAKIEHEDNDIIVFWDINPKAPVHLLVVPKKHLVSLKEVKLKDLDLVKKMIQVSIDLAKKKKIDGGFRIVINSGKNAGQIVDHLHLHLLGGWSK